VFAQMVDAAGSPGYRSLIVTRRDAPLQSLEQLLGRPRTWRFAMGEPSSTSGSVMPSYALFVPRGIRPDEHFLAVRRGTHAETVEAVLSGASVDEFARLVQTGDVAALTRIPGIGKKTAERMVVELRDRAADFGGGGGPLQGAGAAADPQSEATVALQQLGYKPAEAARMARDAVAAGDDAAAIIRKALQSALR